MNPHVRMLVGWLVGHNFPKKLHFHAPIGELLITLHGSLDELSYTILVVNYKTLSRTFLLLSTKFSYRVFIKYCVFP